MALTVKNLPAIQETWVHSLGWEDPLEEGMAIHSIFLPGESPWAEEPGGLQSMELQRAGHDWATKHCTQWQVPFCVDWNVNISFLVHERKPRAVAGAENARFLKGQHGVSPIRWLLMLTSQTKNKSQWSVRLIKSPQMASCCLTGAQLLLAARPPDSRPLASWPSLFGS